jgi:predicted O-methyltransferase YrrM
VSWKAASRYADNSLDFVFIDAAHDLESVTKDIAAWWPKVREGGLLAGHDIDQPGVESAVYNAFGSTERVSRRCWQVRKPHER